MTKIRSGRALRHRCSEAAELGWNKDGTVKDKSKVAFPPLTSGALSSYCPVRCAGYLASCDLEQWMDACALNTNGLNNDLDGERHHCVGTLDDDRDTRMEQDRIIGMGELLNAGTSKARPPGVAPAAAESSEWMGDGRHVVCIDVRTRVASYARAPCLHLGVPPPKIRPGVGVAGPAKTLSRGRS